MTLDVDEGWASGGHAELPCYPLRSCPFSVVDESVRAGRPKFRLTIDLSWPHPGMLLAASGDAVDSVNDGIDRSAWPANRLVRVSEYAEAAAQLQGVPSALPPAPCVGGVACAAPPAEAAAALPSCAPPASPRHVRRRRVRLWGLDCRAFYRAVGRQRRELWRNGVWLPSGVRLDERCCFGDAAAATKCARISNFLVFHIRKELERVDAEFPTRDAEWLEWLAARREAAAAAGLPAARFACLHWAAMYIDDSMGASADDLLFDVHGAPVLRADGQQLRRAQAHFEAARAVLERFGWGSAPGKEQPPAERVESLGVELTLADARLRLSLAKRERYAAQAERVAGQTTCERAAFEQLVGRLQFAVQCFPVGQQHTRAAWRALRARYRLAGGAVGVSKAVQRDLLWWAAELRAPGHAGVPLAQTALPPVGAGTAAIYADAAGSGGFFAWAVAGGELLYVVDEWTVEEDGLLICEKELLASTAGLVALAPLLGRFVLSFTDSTVAQAAMRRMASGAERMDELVRRRTAWLYEHGVVEGVARVTSRNNVWADWGSRGRTADVLTQAQRLGLRPREVTLPAVWRDTSALLALPPSQPPSAAAAE